MEDDNPTAQALLISENRIENVGDNDEIRAAVDEQTEVIDLQGKTVIPGFVDSHTHLMGFGLTFSRVDLSDTKSLEEALTLIKERKARTEPGRWVIAVEFDESQWEENRLPKKEELDSVSSIHPIVMKRMCGHMAVANTPALQHYSEVWETVDRSSGLLLEDAALNMNKVVNPTEYELIEGLEKAIQHAHSSGVTTVSDIVRTNYIEIYNKLRAQNKLRIRIHANLFIEHLKDRIEMGSKHGLSDDILWIGGIKIFEDGSLGARTAALLEPYSDDPNHNGMLFYSQDELDKIVKEVDHNGFQLVIHAIGDRAINQVLNSYDKVINDPGNPLRHRIEHMEVLNSDLIERMKRMNLVASLQPNFVGKWSNYGGLNMQRLGEKRWRLCNPFRTIKDAGLLMAFGSDCMPMDPLFGIHSAVNHPLEEQRISVMDALKMYTINAAYAISAEDKIGSIKKGKLADLVVLSEDILNSKEINNIDVDMTIFNGEVVFISSASH